MSSTCCVCQKPKATLQCGCCKEAVCKNCAQFLEEGRFSYMTKVPELLSHGAYCTPCFDFKVMPEVDVYDADVKAARNIAVFFKDQSKETRLMKRTEKPFKIVDCEDREETLLRLAYFAVQAKFNAIIDVEITSKKVRNGAYQTHLWSGTAIPTNYTPRR